MSDITISYKGSSIATMDATGTKTLLTEGKYCEDDITVEYVKPSGGSEYEDFSGGNILSITSHGTEYILTDYLGSMSGLFSFKFADSSKKSYEGYFSLGYNSNRNQIQRYQNDNALSITFVSTSINNITYPGYSTGSPVVITFSTLGLTSNIANKPLVIFGSYYNGNLENTKSASTFYGLNIFDETATALAKFRPWLENNVPCVKDLVSGTIYYNSGTGGFDYTDLQGVVHNAN